MKYIFNVIFIFLYFTRKSVIVRATNSKHDAPENTRKAALAQLHSLKEIILGNLPADKKQKKTRRSLLPRNVWRSILCVEFVDWNKPVQRDLRENNKKNNRNKPQQF